MSRQSFAVAQQGDQNIPYCLPCFGLCGAGDTTGVLGGGYGEIVSEVEQGKNIY